jgi:hypothetical protein
MTIPFEHQKTVVLNLKYNYNTSHKAGIWSIKSLHSLNINVKGDFMKTSSLIFVFLTFIISLPLAAQPASSDKKIDNLIGKMTLEEKIDFIGGYQDFHIRSIPRLGILQTNMADGPGRCT